MSELHVDFEKEAMGIQNKNKKKFHVFFIGLQPLC